MTSRAPTSRAPMIFRTILIGLTLPVVCLMLAVGLPAQPHPEWTMNRQPFRIAGNLYYVGSQDLASYLVTTPAGNILINSNLESSVPQIRRNVEALGFRFSDTKILLISHAHFDHAAGSAKIKQLTGAKYEVMDADVPVVETGGRADFFYGGRSSYRPAKVDRVLHDGDEVRLGGVVLVAHRTAGHTKGCTTWTMKVAADGRTYDAVIVGGTTVLSGYRLVGDRRYPKMSEDFARSFRTLRGLPCDIFLGAHGSYFGMAEKLGRMNEGRGNRFVDPEGYRSFVDEREQAYRTELAKQAKARR